jgi:GH25 family lysozyme M1 (1,4-beta-N-acetylmuramidase)
MKGVDISEHNNIGFQDFLNLKNEGYEFVIIRLGFGTHTMDEMFLEHYENAKRAGLRISVYHFSEALNPETAVEEAKFVRDTLERYGIGCERIWLDMENSSWKERNEFDYSKENVTAICKAFLDELAPLKTGLYASYSWLTDLIDWQSLGCPVWNAQYNTEDDFKGTLWQYTDKELIGGRRYDANYCYNNII